MGDSNLDEFFAKKDRSKKGKSKAKYTTTENIAKNLEEGGKKVETVTKKEPKEKTTLSSTSTPSSISNEILVQEEDEWKEIEDEKERDYSGLKIQALSISDKEKEDEQYKEQQIDPNGDVIKSSEEQFGPWKMASGTVTSLPAAPVGEIETESKEDIKGGSGTYKPPHLRNVTSTTSVNVRRSNKAPEISSELHFPSLSAAASESSKGNKSNESSLESFQSVKHGVKTKVEGSQGLRLDLENKFAALPQEN